MTPKKFMRELAGLNFDNAFNPYSHRCDVHDCHDAPRRRRDSLFAMLDAAAATEVDSIWIGRDLGYRGGRRTGLALTDDVHMDAHARRWGVSVERPTKGQVVAERTAAVIWSVLAKIEVRVFLWNVFPLHPYQSNDPFSNRSHNSTERRAGEKILAQLMHILRPSRLVAIGNDAALSADRLAQDHEVVRVRHPSYGGQTQFLKQMHELYRLPEGARQASML